MQNPTRLLYGARQQAVASLVKEPAVAGIKEPAVTTTS